MLILHFNYNLIILYLYSNYFVTKKFYQRKCIKKIVHYEGNNWFEISLLFSDLTRVNINNTYYFILNVRQESFKCKQT